MKELLVEAGIRTMYQLDDYDEMAVRIQVSRELAEILELNQPRVLEKRLAYVGIGKAEDYMNQWIETSEGHVLAGIRHMGGNLDKPFVFFWPSFKIQSLKTVVEALKPIFDLFNPQHYIFWSRPDCNNYDTKVIQQRFIGRVKALNQYDLSLVKPDAYYEWYEKEYQDFHKKNPAYRERIPMNSKELMDHCLKEGLLFFMKDESRTLGLIAGEREEFLGEPSIYLNELLVADAYRGQGYGTKLLGSFIQKLDATYFTCYIDSENISSTRTALRSGQKIFSQECSVPV